MYRFFQKISLLVILLLPIFYLLNINMNKAVIDKSCLKQNWVMNIKNQEYDLVFLGSSRTENMIDAKMISEKTGKKVINNILQKNEKREINI